MSDEINVQDLEAVSGGAGFGATKDYITKQGDNLWNIAQQHDIDVFKLYQINRPEILKWFKKMNPGKPVPADDQLINYLYVGMTLQVPV